MSGIAGMILSGIEPEPDIIQKMISTLSHRGDRKNDAVIYRSDSAIFAQHSSYVEGISQVQPILFSSSINKNRLAICFDGEIFNASHLQKLLLTEGYSFETNTDAEIVGAAYDCWKEDCLDQLDGIFAFAIWDETQKEFFAARDRFGEKPFFYTIQNGNFYFSSEMKSFWNAGISKSANRQMLFNYITIGYSTNPLCPEETFFENIYRLPASCFLVYYPDTKETIIEKYWEIDAGDQHNPINQDDAITEFSGLLSNAIKLRSRNNDENSCLVENMDDLLILLVGNKFPADSENPLFKNYLSFTEQIKEFQLEKISSTNSVTINSDTISPARLIDEWKQFMYLQEEPLTQPGKAFSHYCISQQASGLSKKVFHHIGSTELMAGDTRHFKWFWQELFRKRKLIRSGEIEGSRKNGFNEKFTIKNIAASLLPELATVFLEHQYLFHALSHPELSRSFIKAQSREAYYTTPELNSLNSLIAFEMFEQGLEEKLRYSDRNGAAAGVQYYHPFLDHQLVSFIFSLPSTYKIKDGWNKWLVRKSIEKVSPEINPWFIESKKVEDWKKLPAIQEIFSEARQKLIQEKILKKNAFRMTTTVDHIENYDWRYLAAAEIL